MSLMGKMLDYNFTVTGKKGVYKDIEKQLDRDKALEKLDRDNALEKRKAEIAKRKAEIAERKAEIAEREGFYISIENIAGEQMDITEDEIHRFFEPHYPDGTPAQDRPLRSEDEVLASDLEEFLAWKAEARRKLNEKG